MSAPGSLAERLEIVRRSIDPAWDRLYGVFVDHLRASGTTDGSPRVGDEMPAFALPDGAGDLVSLHDLLRSGPVVVSLYRGNWCPYCRTEMTAWNETAPQVRALGGSVVSITPEVGGIAESYRRETGQEAPVLCDLDQGLALRLGLLARLTEEVRDAYLAIGRDLGVNYGDGGWFIPVPATYLVDRSGIVRFAEADVDFRRRAEPAQVLEVLRSFA